MLATSTYQACRSAIFELTPYIHMFSWWSSSWHTWVGVRGLRFGSNLPARFRWAPSGR